jgi:hypothetical protein
VRHINIFQTLVDFYKNKSGLEGRCALEVGAEIAAEALSERIFHRVGFHACAQAVEVAVAAHVRAGDCILSTFSGTERILATPMSAQPRTLQLVPRRVLTLFDSKLHALPHLLLDADGRFELRAFHISLLYDKPAKTIAQVR